MMFCFNLTKQTIKKILQRKLLLGLCFDLMMFCLNMNKIKHQKKVAAQALVKILLCFHRGIALKSVRLYLDLAECLSRYFNYLCSVLKERKQLP